MKKIITLILMATMLVACGQTSEETTPEEPEVVETEGTETESEETSTLEGDVKAFVEAWNGAAKTALNATVADEANGTTVTFALVDEDVTGDAIFKTKKAAEKVGETLDLTGINEYATKVVEANTTLASEVANLISTATVAEEGTEGTTLVGKFEISEAGLTLEVFDEIVVLTNGETVTYYTAEAANVENLKAAQASLLELLAGQPAECLLQAYEIQ